MRNRVVRTAIFMMLCLSCVAKSDIAHAVDVREWDNDRFKFLQDYGELSFEANTCGLEWSHDFSIEWQKTAIYIHGKFTRRNSFHPETLYNDPLYQKVARGKYSTGWQIGVNSYRLFPDKLDCKKTQREMRAYEAYFAKLYQAVLDGTAEKSVKAERNNQIRERHRQEAEQRRQGQ